MPSSDLLMLELPSEVRALTMQAAAAFERKQFEVAGRQYEAAIQAMNASGLNVDLNPKLKQAVADLHHQRGRSDYFMKQTASAILHYTRYELPIKHEPKSQSPPCVSSLLWFVGMC